MLFRFAGPAYNSPSLRIGLPSRTRYAGGLRRHASRGALGSAAVLAAVATVALTVEPSHFRQAGATSGLARLPPALAEAVSVRLGESSPAYRAWSSGSGVFTFGGGIHGSFTRAGAELRVRAGTLELSLARAGRGNRLHPGVPAAPRAKGSEVLYRLPGISEIYRNGPLGLEQAFRVRSRALGRRGALVLAIGLRGSLRASQHGSQVLFSNPAGVIALRYGGLAAIDATGRRLRARMALYGNELRLVVDDRRARYPVLVDPWIAQGPKLTFGGTERRQFGESVALSENGNTALVGAPDLVGAAYVFTRTNGIWSQQATLTGGKEEDGLGAFGSGVALSADGNTALVGAEEDDFNIGAAFVFTRSKGVWTQQGPKLTGSGESGEGRFGVRVAIAEDGNTALIGATSDNHEAGAAFVFVRSSGVWTQQAKLTGSGGTGLFGSAVGLSSDGNLALVGAARSDKVFFFIRTGSTWAQEETIAQTDETFGSDGALSAEGNTAVVGAPFENAAWVFTRTGSLWTSYTQTRLTGTGAFGVSVAIDAKGDHIAVGAPREAGESGEAYVFARSGGSWSEEAPLAGNSENGAANFGESAAFAGDGGTVLIGGPGDSDYAGAAWPYSKQKINPVLLMHLVSGPKIVQPGEPVELGGSWTVALPGMGSITCANSTLTGSMIDNAFTKDAFSITAASFADQQPGVCTSTTPFGPQATLTAALTSGSPYLAFLTTSGAAQINGNRKVLLTAQFQGSSAPTQCSWQASKLSGAFARAGAPVSLQFKEQALALVKTHSSANCPSSAQLTASAPLYGFDETGGAQPIYLELLPG